MKIHSAHLRFRFQFGLCLAFFLPLNSYAGMEVPYWLYPEWIAAKVMDFHARNSERYEQTQQAQHAQHAQLVAKAKNNPNGNNQNGAVNTAQINATNGTPAGDLNQRKTSLAPVENATPKVNEKYLSKDELMELRKQLRQK